MKIHPVVWDHVEYDQPTKKSFLKERVEAVLEEKARGCNLCWSARQTGPSNSPGCQCWDADSGDRFWLFYHERPNAKMTGPATFKDWTGREDLLAMLVVTVDGGGFTHPPSMCGTEHPFVLVFLSNPLRSVPPEHWSPMLYAFKTALESSALGTWARIEELINSQAIWDAAVYMPYLGIGLPSNGDDAFFCQCLLALEERSKLTEQAKERLWPDGVSRFWRPTKATKASSNVALVPYEMAREVTQLSHAGLTLSKKEKTRVLQRSLTSVNSVRERLKDEVSETDLAGLAREIECSTKIFLDIK